jgi:hypothetical protein
MFLFVSIMRAISLRYMTLLCCKIAAKRITGLKGHSMRSYQSLLHWANLTSGVLATASTWKYNTVCLPAGPTASLSTEGLDQSPASAALLQCPWARDETVLVELCACFWADLVLYSAWGASTRKQTVFLSFGRFKSGIAQNWLVFMIPLPLMQLFYVFFAEDIVQSNSVYIYITFTFAQLSIIIMIIIIIIHFV